MKKNFEVLIITCLCLITIGAKAQLTTIDHWETAVFETDTWHYLVGTAAPPANWNQPSFSPTSWQTGQGGIGYADGDDNTIIPATMSVYMRLDFNILDTAKIMAAILHADYDDAFVAYLNGNEIARANIGTVGVEPNYLDTAYIFREAVMYQGQSPTPFLLVKNDLNQHLNQGTNTLAIQVHNFNATSSDMSSRFFFSVGLNDATTAYSPVPTWFTTPFISSNLPLIKINTNGQTIQQEIKITADMQVIDNGAGNLNYFDDIPNNYNDKIGIEIRGASSVGFPKNGFGIETRDSLGDNNNVELLGMPSENDWVLHGPYADKTLIRNLVTYHIGGRLGRYNPRVRICELFLDNQYWGVYLLKEKIKRDKNRVDISKLTPSDTIGDDLTGGYIFKIDRDMGSDNGWFPQIGYGYLAYHHPNAGDLQPVQKSYIQNYFTSFENMLSSNNYAHPNTGYRGWIDVPSFIDYMMMQEITRNIDAYRLSAFMYKDKDSDGGKLYAGPIWDFNLGYGNEDFCDNGASTSWAFNYRYVCGSPFPYMWERLVAHSEFRNDFHCRWNELRSTVLNTDTILHFIDSVVIVLADAQTRNFDRWDVLGNYVWPNAYIGQTYTDEITYLKNWITQRLSWMDANMIGSAANCVTPTTEQEITPDIKVYPSPFQDYLTFEIGTEQSTTIQLYDALGQNIETVHLDKAVSYTQINTNHLPQGVYFYAVFENERLISSGKIIK